MDRNSIIPAAGTKFSTSRPMRARGSKLHPLSRSRDPAGRLLSRPMRARGSKLISSRRQRREVAVAPHAGAWIETPFIARYSTSTCVAPHAGAWIETAPASTLFAWKACRAPCGRVDRNYLPRQGRAQARGRAPCGRVDRNRATGVTVMAFDESRPMRARGSKPRHGFAGRRLPLVAPHAGAWIET